MTMVRTKKVCMTRRRRRADDVDEYDNEDDDKGVLSMTMGRRRAGDTIFQVLLAA